uniref:Uncharacterized protein n=1 Tax=Rhizophora mucronata TaxID=61149 RepID=A0A2P2N4P9_RHIMU
MFIACNCLLNSFENFLLSNRVLKPFGGQCPLYCHWKVSLPLPVTCFCLYEIVCKS